MSPERQTPTSQYRSRWRRKEIGTIRLTYGYTVAEHYRARGLLDELYRNDQLEVLRALQRDQVSIKDLLAAKKAGRHKRDDLLIDLRLRLPLWSTLEAMVDKRPGGDKHRTRLLTSLKKFAGSAPAAALGKHATIAQLKDVDYRALRSTFGSPADWNHLRKAIGATLSSLLDSEDLDGKDHPFRKSVMKRIPSEPEPELEVDVTVPQFLELVSLLPDVYHAVIWTLAITGMRLETEYLKCTAADKRAALPGIYCPGSKNADATGIIPIAPALWKWVDAGVPAPRKIKGIRSTFHRACVGLGLGQYEETGEKRRQLVRRDRSGPPRPGEPAGPIYKEMAVLRYHGLTLHGLRHLALQFAIDGGAALQDVQSFARHADPTMTMRYLKRSGRRRAADAIGRTLAPPTEEKKA
jgi:integrase